MSPHKKILILPEIVNLWIKIHIKSVKIDLIAIFLTRKNMKKACLAHQTNPSQIKL